MTDKPRLLVSNGRAAVWDVATASRLRANHRIVGSLTGTLPQAAQQNVFLAFPLMLLPEETAMLVEHELALLVDDRTSHHRASAGEACDYAAQLQADIAHEREAIERRELSKRANITARFGRQIEEKRAERIAQRREVSDASPSPLVQPHHTINIAGASHSPWYRRQDSESAALYPDLRVGKTRRPVDESRRRVFADLNSHGYYQGAALRFGGDYLAYPGDQLRFHSHFTATVLSSTMSRLDPMHLVAHGRLATGVKKAHLYAGLNDEGEVVYLTLEWAGM